jgi:hypothetical protein
MDLTNLLSAGNGTIAATILTIVTGFVGTFLIKYKNKLGLAIKFGHKVVEAADEFEDVIADNTVTPDEVMLVKQKLAEAKSAWKALTGKI